MNKYEAMYQFFSGFGIPAYVETSVPPEADYPYLTYAPIDGDYMSGEASMLVNLWYWTDSEAEPNEKVREIAEAIGFGGTCVGFDGGMMWLKKGNPWAQSLADEDPMIKRRYLNVDVEYISMS